MLASAAVSRDFDAGRIDAEVGASLLVIADGDENAGHLASDEDISESAKNDQCAAGDPEPSLDRKIDNLIAD